MTVHFRKYLGKCKSDSLEVEINLTAHECMNGTNTFLCIFCIHAAGLFVCMCMILSVSINTSELINILLKLEIQAHIHICMWLDV